MRLGIADHQQADQRAFRQDQRRAAVEADVDLGELGKLGGKAGVAFEVGADRDFAAGAHLAGQAAEPGVLGLLQADAGLQPDSVLVEKQDSRARGAHDGRCGAGDAVEAGLRRGVEHAKLMQRAQPRGLVSHRDGRRAVFHNSHSYRVRQDDARQVANIVPCQ